MPNCPLSFTQTPSSCGPRTASCSPTLCGPASSVHFHFRMHPTCKPFGQPGTGFWCSTGMEWCTHEQSALRPVDVKKPQNGFASGSQPNLSPSPPRPSPSGPSPWTHRPFGRANLGHPRASTASIGFKLTGLRRSGSKSHQIRSASHPRASPFGCSAPVLAWPGPEAICVPATGEAVNGYRSRKVCASLIWPSGKTLPGHCPSPMANCIECNNWAKIINRMGSSGGIQWDFG